MAAISRLFARNRSRFQADEPLANVVNQRLGY
jgi:hypothetical protein